jgi:predicted nucleic acid-binding Zn ribbon protein
MPVQRKTSGLRPIDFGKHAFSGYSAYRYGATAPDLRRPRAEPKLPSVSIQKLTAKPRTLLPPKHSLLDSFRPRLASPITIRPITPDSKLSPMVRQTAEFLRPYQSNRWEHEATALASLRSTFVEAGQGFAAAEAEALDIIRRAFNLLGRGVETRVSWEDGQRYITYGPARCVWCFGEMDEEDRTSGRRFCSPHCARSAITHFDYDGPYSNSPLAWHAGYILRLDRQESRRCVVCSKSFKTTSHETQTCSPACKKVWQAGKLEMRNCRRCDAPFQPLNSQAEFCGPRCLHLSKEHVKKARRHEAIANQPGRLCAHCSTIFRPKRVGCETDRYCSESCQKAAAYQRQRQRAADLDSRPMHWPSKRCDCEECDKEFRFDPGLSTPQKFCGPKCGGRQSYLNKKRRAQAA